MTNINEEIFQKNKKPKKTKENEEKKKMDFIVQFLANQQNGKKTQN